MRMKDQDQDDRMLVAVVLHVLPVVSGCRLPSEIPNTSAQASVFYPYQETQI